MINRVKRTLAASVDVRKLRPCRILAGHLPLHPVSGPGEDRNARGEVSVCHQSVAAPGLRTG